VYIYVVDVVVILVIVHIATWKPYDIRGCREYLRWVGVSTFFAPDVLLTYLADTSTIPA
jgi:hypothetical protein